MSTGDINNNIEKLRSELASLKYASPLDISSLKAGDPAALLPVLHFALYGFSRLLAKFLNENNFDLYAKSDARFLDGVYKLLITEFNYRPTLTAQQFLTPGFAERKILTVVDVIKHCKKKHNELYKAFGGSTTHLASVMRSPDGKSVQVSSSKVPQASHMAPLSVSVSQQLPLQQLPTQQSMQQSMQQQYATHVSQQQQSLQPNMASLMQLVLDQQREISDLKARVSALEMRHR
eukprot:TRINITY_DN8701_c0_g1_i1.p1 TRINITY_DN8701_c0_g1~~TRINITY_DN8701_c0_g1_i1.p1  ORF type:complete len:234 (-),score=35.11 TRINITY_DN8701_c0_g1_i1:110-811(-)